MASESQKRLALAIIDFLTSSSKNGSISDEDKDSLEVASQCIADAFKVDPTDKDAMANALGGQSLTSIYGVFEKMKTRTPANQPKPASPKPEPKEKSGPTEEEKAEAEALKTQGNQAMAKKDHKTAVEFYTSALALVPGNPIYLSNRAAAYSSLGEYDKAITDAQVAVDTDPKYTKAWSRLGLARFAKGDARGAMEAYKAGIDAEGSGGSEIMRRGYETAKKKVDEEEAVTKEDKSTSRGEAGPSAGGLPDLSSLAGMFGGGGAPGGSGGMPDFGSIMNNPMFAQMAQNLMSNPSLMQNMMNNPKVKEMMESVGGGGGGSGGGMPDLGSLMSDPNIADLAKNLMGGAGRGAQ
ncbi:Small glutamine-rich tetratricopeptide repeat-containing protein 2 [Rhizina undulata]